MAPRIHIPVDPIQRCYAFDTWLTDSNALAPAELWKGKVANELRRWVDPVDGTTDSASYGREGWRSEPDYRPEKNVSGPRGVVSKSIDTMRDPASPTLTDTGERHTVEKGLTVAILLSEFGDTVWIDTKYFDAVMPYADTIKSEPERIGMKPLVFSKDGAFVAVVMPVRQ